ncbi:hypothetical protein GCM10027091_45770 [Streptomyces daliensis]
MEALPPRQANRAPKGFRTREPQVTGVCRAQVEGTGPLLGIHKGAIFQRAARTRRRKLFRSGGASAVLEWCAVIGARRSTGASGSDGSRRAPPASAWSRARARWAHPSRRTRRPTRPVTRRQVADVLGTFVEGTTALVRRAATPVGVPAAVRQNHPCRKAVLS